MESWKKKKMQTKELLINILNIAGITENQDKIVKEFEERLQVAAQIDLRGMVDKSEIGVFEEKMAEAGNDKEKIQLVISDYFTQEQITKVYYANIELFFNVLIKDLFENPTEEQMKQLNELVLVGSSSN